MDNITEAHTPRYENNLFGHRGLQHNFASNPGVSVPAGVIAEVQPRTELTDLASTISEAIRMVFSPLLAGLQSCQSTAVPNKNGWLLRQHMKKQKLHIQK